MERIECESHENLGLLRVANHACLPIKIGRIAMKTFMILVSQLTLIAGLLAGGTVAAEDSDAPSGSLLQYGTMHEAIGQKQDQGRVRFSELIKRPHFYGVAALAGLQGEATIWDGNVTVTTVDEHGHLLASKGVSSEQQATMLVGAYVPSWTQHEETKPVTADALDAFIESTAKQAGVNLEKPFLFTIEGDFSDVDLHVINGACPVHARMKKIELSEEQKPFEAQMSEISGKVVGIFAKDAVGKLTHPATSTHLHLLYTDPETGKRVTGHLEKIGLQKGAMLRLPAN